jgi:high affinity Mn2+ porin
MAYLNNAHMGNYRESLQLQPTNPDITATRAYRVKYGFGLNWEQELSRELGVFAGLGWNDGHTETWAFTEIDATGALGLLLKGKRWCRPGDTVGLALVVNGLSNGHRDYLAAGGLGFIIGDGRLRYGEEEILESFYNWQIKQGINVTFDFQGVNNPAFNRDRGPVAIGGARVHFEF